MTEEQKQEALGLIEVYVSAFANLRQVSPTSPDYYIVLESYEDARENLTDYLETI